MRITVDTNVMVSSSFWDGASCRIMEIIENKEIELVISKDIIEEFLKVLEYEGIQQKIKDKNLEIKRTIEKIISISTVIEPSKKLDIIKEDPTDNKIIECAVEGNVDYIISRDKHLLKLKEFAAIKIIKPEEFLDIINKK